MCVWRNVVQPGHYFINIFYSGNIYDKIYKIILVGAFLLDITILIILIKKGGLHCYGHVERKDVEDWVSKKLEVQGCRGRGRPKKTWEQSVKCDTRKYGSRLLGTS